MKIKYYGTASADGIPNPFCDCEVCEHARKVGGKEIRSRSQSVIDDVLMIDFSADTIMRTLHQGLDLRKINTIIFTHSHADHFYPNDLVLRLSNYASTQREPLVICGNKTVTTKIREVLEHESKDYSDSVIVKELELYKTYDLNGYKVTPLKASHSRVEECFIYQIEKDGKCILYAHDTGELLPEVWDYWEKNKPFFDLVSMDCNQGSNPGTKSHMGIEENITLRNKLVQNQYAINKVIVCLSHFSHNSKTHNLRKYMNNEMKRFYLMSDLKEINIQ